MKFHIKVASDILTKGLSLSVPHNTLGQDGMLLDTQHQPLSVSVPEESASTESLQPEIFPPQEEEQPPAMAVVAEQLQESPVVAVKQPVGKQSRGRPATSLSAAKP